MLEDPWKFCQPAVKTSQNIVDADQTIRTEDNKNDEFAEAEVIQSNNGDVDEVDQPPN